MFQALHRAPSNSWNYAHFCVINQGGIRAAIDKGGKVNDTNDKLIYAKSYLYFQKHWPVLYKISLEK